MYLCILVHVHILWIIQSTLVQVFICTGFPPPLHCATQGLTGFPHTLIARAAHGPRDVHQQAGRHGQLGIHTKSQNRSPATAESNIGETNGQDQNWETDGRGSGERMGTAHNMSARFSELRQFAK